IPGLFGIGIAFPQTVKTIDGEDEAAVGVEKFWNTTSNVMVQNVWQKYSYHSKTPTGLS
ncbi:hypothetical protein JG636_18805, partial [Vibrio cholerae]|nr:hypothetical protein [Vibrio cholerae]